MTSTGPSSWRRARRRAERALVGSVIAAMAIFIEKILRRGAKRTAGHESG